jgi:cyclase
VPLTVGGGIRNTADVEKLLRSGADKVAINTAAVRDPNLLKAVAQRFGSQCLVLSVQAKRCSQLGWEVMTDCGRERSGQSVLDWVKEAENLGVGEILLTSVDYDGTRKGMDLELLTAVSKVVSVPVIASGGLSCATDFCSAVHAGADAVAIASALHFRDLTVEHISRTALLTGIAVRNLVFQP